MPRSGDRLGLVAQLAWLLNVLGLSARSGQESCLSLGRPFCQLAWLSGRPGSWLLKLKGHFLAAGGVSEEWTVYNLDLHECIRPTVLGFDLPLAELAHSNLAGALVLLLASRGSDNAEPHPMIGRSVVWQVQGPGWLFMLWSCRLRADTLIHLHS